MGVPAFFRWLSMKYSQIVSHCIEEKGKAISDDVNLPIDSSQPNPNNIEFDNLYLDMNGIIHPCTHPENKPAPKNEEEMFHEIFLYIDRIFSVVRPRRLIYMAVDGVAPRAKMNQQRSRRFRAGKEAREKHLTIERLRSELLQKGAKLPDRKDPSEHFDSNCITPGTPFMARLTIALQYYVYHKLNSDPGWKNIQVILSDANAPGEGEHKIMDFIRRQRNNPTHDPDTKHCLCGADADLIMLGLATHEPYFTIIREEFKPNQPRPCEICGQMDHTMTECEGLPSLEFNTGANNKGSETEFIFIHLNILREYLQQELLMTNLSIPYDFERAVDDWVFMCFFVGNDFLPHLPSLEIREKAIDRLIGIYKESVLKNGGWLTDSGRVNIAQVQLIMKDLALLEDEIFKRRRGDEVQNRQRNRDRRKRTKRQKLNDNVLFNKFSSEFVSPGSGEKFSWNSVRKDAFKASKDFSKVTPMPHATEQNFAVPLNARKRGHDEVEHDEEDLKDLELDRRDEVKLWEDGYRTRYYQSKFGVSVDENPEFCVNVAHQYLRGLCWVLAYYYQGCVSWTWYYPYHYAPFAVDFINLTAADVTFEKNSKPFNPLEQLMGVFPADSKSHVPPAWQNLMTDSDSPVIDFYPTDFKIDLNGKRYDWQGVALLPFVDETRLLTALKNNYSFLTAEEKRRNVIGPDRYFVRVSHPLAEVIKVIYESENSGDSTIDPQLTNGVSGRMWCDMLSYLPGNTVKSPIPEFCDNINDVQVISCFFKDPQYAANFVFPSRLLKNVVLPNKTLGPNAIKPERRHFDINPAKRMMQHSLNNSADHSSASNSRNSSFSDRCYRQEMNQNNQWDNFNNNRRYSDSSIERRYESNQQYYPSNQNNNSYSNQYNYQCHSNVRFPRGRQSDPNNVGRQFLNLGNNPFHQNQNNNVYTSQQGRGGFKNNNNGNRY